MVVNPKLSIYNFNFGGHSITLHCAPTHTCDIQDVTEQVTAGAEAEEEELLLREQELSNYLQQKNYVKAVGVAITLDQPFRVFTIFQGNVN